MPLGNIIREATRILIQFVALHYMPVMDADGPAPKVLLADKGYDADFIREDM